MILTTQYIGNSFIRSDAIDDFWYHLFRSTIVSRLRLLIFIQIVPIYLMIRWITPYKFTYSKHADEFKYHTYLLILCILVAICNKLIVVFMNQFYEPYVFYFISIWIEACAYIPQITMIYKSHISNQISITLLICFSFYRTLFFLKYIVSFFALRDRYTQRFYIIIK